MVSWAWAVQGLAHRRRTISSHLGSNISYNSADVRFAIGFLTFSIYKKCAIVFCIAAEFFSTSTAQKLSSSILHNLWIWIADQSSTFCCCWYRQYHQLPASIVAIYWPSTIKCQQIPLYTSSSCNAQLSQLDLVLLLEYEMCFSRLYILHSAQHFVRHFSCVCHLLTQGGKTGDGVGQVLVILASLSSSLSP